MAVLEVAVAIIRDDSGCVLINQRLDDLHQHWEFPGGKFEAGESPEQALVRECREELDIRIESSRLLIRFTHQYPDKTVRLHVYDVLSYQGIPRAQEGQPLKWVEVSSLYAQNLLPADKVIIRALQLPDICIVTPELLSKQLLVSLQDALDSSLKKRSSIMLQLRQHQLESTAYVDLAAEVYSLLCSRLDDGKQVFLQFNTDLKTYKRINLVLNEAVHVGFHVRSDMLDHIGMIKRELGSDVLIGASVHEQSQLDLCISAGIDYCVYGTIKPSLTHPGKSAMGWERLGESIYDRPAVVYAIGGLEQGDLNTAKHHGAQGIAGIRSFFPTLN